MFVGSRWMHSETYSKLNTKFTMIIWWNFIVILHMYNKTILCILQFKVKEVYCYFQQTEEHDNPTAWKAYKVAKLW